MAYFSLKLFYEQFLVLTLSQTSSLFLSACNTSFFENTVGNSEQKLLVNSNFSFSHSVLYLFGEPFAIFVKFKIVVCKLFQFAISGVYIYSVAYIEPVIEVESP